MTKSTARSAEIPGIVQSQALADPENIKMHSEQGSTKGFSSWPAFPALLGKSDLVLFMILIVVLISYTNSVLFARPVTFVYWLAGAVTFLVPCAIVTQWLARRHPGGCAPYLWVKRIAGPNWSFISAFCIWLPGVLALISVIDNGLIFIHYLIPDWFVTPIEQCIGIICLLSIATAFTCIPLRWLKDFLGALAVLYLGVFALLGGIGLWWLMTGHAPAPASNALMTFQSRQPTAASNSIYSIILLAFLGVDIPLLMSAEVRGGPNGVRKASSYVWWGGTLACLAYLSGTFGIMLILPGKSAGSPTASVQAVEAVLGPLAANCTDIILMASQLAISIAYILMFARVFVFVARDRRLPARLAALNRQGVPVFSIILQAAIVAMVTIFIFAAAQALFGTIVRPDDMAVEIRSVTQAGTEIAWISSTIQLFVLALIQLYRSRIYRRSEQRWLRYRQTLLAAVCLLGIAASLIGIWSTLAGSWVPHLIPKNWWLVLVFGFVSLAFMFGWLFSEWPRMRTLLREQRSINTREKKLREELLDSYKEQQLLVEQQQILLAEVNRLYHEQSRAAVTDAVTGLPNHRAIMSRLGEGIANSQRSQGSCAILFVDIDDFKLVNDTWGHRAGDAILREVGARLSTTLREEEFVGRYGGEEFAVILSETELIGARYTAEHLRQAVAAKPCKWVVEDSQIIIPITVTVSIGIAVYGLHGLTREELVEYADRGMYQAKRSGRNCISIADVSLATSKERRPGKHQKEKEQLVYAKEGAPEGHVIPAQTVQAFIAVASAHDLGVNDHLHRMLKLARITARKLKLAEDELPLLYLTALLHDIGKIGIPNTILNKSGPLSNEEWMIMQQHPEIGRQILVQTGGIFQQVAGCVVAHHERWDGNGYPKGLAGEAIPLSARIISVIDAFETMTARRPYYEPLTVEEARAELQRCAGRQFDPRVVEAFISVLAEREQKKRQAALTGMPEPADVKMIEGESALNSDKNTHPLKRESYAKSRSR